jgi:hypothetical protein
MLLQATNKFMSVMINEMVYKEGIEAVQCVMMENHWEP